MYKLLIPLRYFRRNWLNIVGVLAVGIAVMVPICVQSVMKGFDEELRARSRDTLPEGRPTMVQVCVDHVGPNHRGSLRLGQRTERVGPMRRRLVRSR